MHFIDEAINEVKAGDGGNGIVSFRKEKYVAFGGPDGGNGGNGGSIFFIGDKGENNLLKLKYHKHLKAKKGINGKNKNQTGANADDIYVRVPLGTIVYSWDNKIIGEILKDEETLMIAKGGKGGKGNKALANIKNQIPMYAEKGDLGESLKIKTELKILADVGLIGYPNVGKSSLISIISNAKTKVSDYPFTTLKPHLGMVYVNNSSFVMADLPGLIENASLGHGMGFKFLKHIERCKILLHICDMSNDDPYKDFITLNQELRMYNKDLLLKPQIIIANKMDIPGSSDKLKSFQAKLNDKNILSMSLLKKQNLQTLKFIILNTLEKNNTKPIVNLQSFKNYTFEEKTPPFTIEKDYQGFYVIKGAKIENFFHKMDFNNEEAIKKFAMFLKKIGVEEQLRMMGVSSPYHKIKICDHIFELLM